MPLLEDSRHAGLLTQLAARAIGTPAEAMALAMADRRCRVGPPPKPVDHLVRAELLHRAGEAAAARAAIDRALEIEPEHLAGNRRRLTWGDDAQRLAAAQCLSRIDPSAAHLKMALAILAADGVSAAGQATFVDGQLRGWVAWTGDEPLTVTLAVGETKTAFRIGPDPRHPLTGAIGSAAQFALSIDARHGRWHGLSRVAGSLALAAEFTAFAAASSPSAGPRSPRTIAADVTVIVPVYRDAAATRACLDSLFEAVRGEPFAIRIVVVDDASPEPKLSAYIRTLRVDTIVHRHNRGFVHAVNSALATVAGGDVLLLNSDTVVPPRFLSRMRTVAHASPDIGTVTPLSNNGELTSQPTPFRENPLPSHQQIMAIDRAAAALAMPPIDLPSGIGFCLYVTRACLDRVGPLSHRYERGYCEDVHLCLAAAAAGLRNVCATNVFVGHAGTRSFTDTKRQLVVRNVARLTAVFPQHEDEVAAFVAADPLRPLRHAIDRTITTGHEGPLVIAAGSGRAHATARARALAAGGRQPLLIVVERQQVGVERIDADGTLITRTRFDLTREAAEWSRWQSALAIEAMDVFCPLEFERLGFATPSAPVTLHVADATKLRPRRSSPAAYQEAATAWQRLADRAGEIVAADAEARSFAAERWPQHAGRIVTDTEGERGDEHAAADPAAPAHRRLGVVLLAETAGCRELLRVIAGRLPRAVGAAPSVVVLGSAGDDLGLMRVGNLFVTGDCDTKDLPELVRRHAVSHLLLLAPGASFGAPTAGAAAATRLPRAAFAWSAAKTASPSHLWLDPGADDTAIADALARWMTTEDHAP